MTARRKITGEGRALIGRLTLAGAAPKVVVYELYDRLNVVVTPGRVRELQREMRRNASIWNGLGSPARLLGPPPAGAA